MKWTNEEIKKLKELVIEGKSYKEIEKIIQTHSYYSIRSKATRLNLSSLLAPKPWTKEDTTLLKKLMIKDGLLPKEAAKIMNRHEQLCRDKARINGFSTLLLHTKLKEQNKKRCPKCRKIFNLQTYIGRYCNTCHSIQQLEYRYSSPKGILMSSKNAAHARANKKGIEFYLSIDDLLEIYHTQKGKCYYTGVTMTHSRKRKNESINLTNISLERINPNKGYTIDNIVLCCAVVNIMKNIMTLDELLWWCDKLIKENENVNG